MIKTFINSLITAVVTAVAKSLKSKDGKSEYLLEEDAIALDYEINMNDSRVIDIIQYNEDVDELLEDIETVVGERGHPLSNTQ